MHGTGTWPETKADIKFVRVDGLEPGQALSPREAEVYAAFRIEKRRREWLGGRLAAKALLAAAGGLRPCDYEITPDRYGRPSCGGELLSISHSGGWALAAHKPGCIFLGADVEVIEPRHPAWYRDYFYPEELKAGPGGPDPSAATRAWSVKEALLKALGLGLSVDPLCIKTGEQPLLYGAALKRHQEMGSPAFRVETASFPEGFWTSVAAGAGSR